MAGFLEDIIGDGSFGNDWKHRDITKAKIYNNDGYDTIVAFDQTKLWLDKSYTVFFQLNNVQGIRYLAFNYPTRKTNEWAIVVVPNGINFIRFAGGSQNVQDLYYGWIGINHAKRNNFSLRCDEFETELFVNGIPAVLTFFKNEIQGIQTSGTEPFYIGRAGFGTTNLVANISEFSIVNYAQSDAEIARDAALGYQTANNPNNFLLNIDFNKNTGQNLTDTSPNNYTITSVGNKNFGNFYP
ncbi:MAG: hypothetical protein COZ18_15010 [Flexibacter sp. CG_4_10_14_3_um_filter_32_15]|nr:MAG: hypothetical protein COZ18_15010 [Flexibacter sp. CG_4_10_14_3_um_filter_32_15]